MRPLFGAKHVNVEQATAQSCPGMWQVVGTLLFTSQETPFRLPQRSALHSRHACCDCNLEICPATGFQCTRRLSSCACLGQRQLHLSNDAFANVQVLVCCPATLVEDCSCVSCLNPVLLGFACCATMNQVATGPASVPGVVRVQGGCAVASIVGCSAQQLHCRSLRERGGP